MHRFPLLLFLLCCLRPAQIVRVASIAPVRVGAVVPRPACDPAATKVVLFSALKLHGERQSNYHEIGGEPLDLDRHVSPRLLFWDGRPHTSASAQGAGLAMLLVVAFEPQVARR